MCFENMWYAGLDVLLLVQWQLREMSRLRPPVPGQILKIPEISL